ncbi:hypothetical protein HN51_068756 [Arachis hypogaea]|uniref:YTH domain-containing family protein n=1 Tax=Arachis hypogaea TaxID=3818 RepID=A0A444Z938_ARAHY|nr:uncharacterized protein LOC107642986 [Arachis ipaensis]XP_020978739.1 uncharacterized protein LOC107642986 [Arachis ipaensis]XP_025653628.1 YTH domain-containing family protein [Arachis hypogaea]QHO10879.1 Zinc finger CCCH domain-containing protein [Arachis hypogaea]RYR10684.1 hypothetical protein Ahy_B05g079155 isoform A [Arachis hypogaea]
MSSDSAKENASVVDSSLTEWKHDIGNSDDPGMSMTTGTGVESIYNTKYFIIKSLNHQNIRLSVEKGIWATQVMNEPILEEAFHNSDSVILIFSVNMSGCFQGYAQMTSSIGWRRDNVWNEGSGKGNPWGRSFNVKWLRLNDLPFHKTLHLKNPLNDYKPVKISRDCQELSPDIGLALCELLDGKNEVDGLLMSSSTDDLYWKGHHSKTSGGFVGGEDYNFHPLHLSWSMSLPYSSMLYQNQAELSQFHSASNRFSGTTITKRLPTTTVSSKVSGTKHARFSSLTEDDFLDMSYEEYLEIHSRCRKQLCLSAAQPSFKQTESLRSNSHGDDSNLDEFDRDRTSSQRRNQ